MHDDDDFDHEHYGLPDFGDQTIPRELIQQLTLSVDVGTATSKLTFSRIHLERIGQMHNTHYQVVLREVLYKSAVEPTPYRSADAVDPVQLAKFVAEAHDQAGIDPLEIEGGAIVLSRGAANAQIIADAVAGSSGRLICVSAGPNLQAVLAAHGSGAVSMSRLRRNTILNIDIGAGSTSLALVHDGEIAGTAGLRLGSRSGQDAGAAAGALMEIVAMAAPSVEDGHHHHHHDLSDMAEDLLATAPLHSHRQVDAITFSGGVAEYLDGEDVRTFGDDGAALAAAIQEQIAAGAMASVVEPVKERICATVIGASHLTEQVAGRSIDVSRSDLLPLRRLRVVRPRLPRREMIGAGEMAQAIRRAHERLDLAPGQQAVALAIPWEGEPSPTALRDMAAGIVQGLQGSATAGAPLVLVFDHDYGVGVYKALRDDLGISNDVVCVGGLELSDFDVIDVAEAADLEDAVPVAVKVMGMARSGWIFPAIEGRPSK
jgi:ethanolamine utilization protein EutA